MRLLLLLVSAFFLAFTASPSQAQRADIVPGELIVRLAPGTPVTALSARAGNAAPAFEAVRPLSKRLGIWLVRYDAGRSDAEAALSAVRSLTGVALAQHNHVVTLRESIPDDVQFGQMWGLDNTGQTGGTPDADVDAPEAWDLTRGGTTAHGDQIVVAIVDNGFDINHPDINYWKNEAEIPGNGIDDDENGYVDDYDGWNAYNSNGSITSASHGTHVSGTSAARSDNELGVTGVNWDAKVMAIQGSSGIESTVVEAYGYALELRATYNETNGAEGAFVVATNSSFGVDFGNPANFPIWCGFYDDLGAAGILSAGATANQNIDIDVQGDVPTACASDYMIAVTNTTHNDTKNGGAAYGATTIDLGAPGTSILSTLPGGTYGNNTGTSMATPHVTGAVALMISGFSGERLQAYKDDPGAVALDVKAALLDGTDPIGITTVTGGRLNLYNSLLETFADDAKSTVIAENTTLSGATFEGENVYVLDGTLLTLEGNITLQADAQGTPSFIYVIGQLQDDDADITLLDGSQIIYRDGGSPILPTPLPGPGSALAFDGSSRVTLLESGNLPTTGAFTVSMWVRADDLSGEPVLVQQGDGDELLYRLDLVEEGDTWHFRYTHTAGEEAVQHVFDDLEVEVDQPYHVALMRALGPDAVRLYVGGERVGGTVGLPTLPDEVAEPSFYLGSGLDILQGFEGLIDEVRVYDTSLFSDVQDTMHETLEGEERDGVLAYYRMEGEDDLLVFDYSIDGGNHATLVGATPTVSPFPIGQSSVFLEGSASGTVGQDGATLDAALTSTDGDDPSLALYAYDADLGAIVSVDDETLPQDVTSRSATIWGAYERGEVEADLMLNYTALPVETVPVGERRLLFRLSPDEEWVDVTPLWTHDTDARRFVRGEVETFGEFAIGFTDNPPVANEDGAARTEAFTLSTAYPNPFRGTAAFTLEVAEGQHVAVEVFDVLGRRVAVLHDGLLAAGAAHRFALDGRDLPSGVYVVRAVGDTFSATQSVTRVR